ncbi:MAG: ATP-binding protein [Hyphomonadaceae bacterium]
MKAPENESARVAAVHSLRFLTRSHVPFLDAAVTLLADVCGAPGVFASLIDERKQVFVASIGMPRTEYDRHETLCQHCIATGRTLAVRDASRDPRFRENPNVACDGGVRSYAAAPIVVGHDLAVGTMCITSPEPNLFDDQAVARLETVAQMVSSHIERMYAARKAARDEQTSEAGEPAAFEQAFGSLSEGVIVFSRAGRVVAGNAAAGQLLEYGEDAIRAIRPEAPNRVYVDVDGNPLPVESLPINRVFETGENVSNVVLGFRTRAGVMRWMSFSGSPIHDDDGHVSMAVVNLHDVTDEIEHERTLERSLRAAALYAYALNVISKAVAIFDAGLKMVDCNEGFTRLCGRRREDLLGLDCVDTMGRRYKPDGTECPTEELPLYQVRASGGAVMRVIMGVDGPDGELRWQSVSAIPVMKPAGGIDKIVLVCRDVTVEQHAADRLKASLELERRNNQAKNDFLGVVSHELRTPMNAVLGSAEMLKLTELDADQKMTLSMLESSGRQMMMLLDDLLDVAALEGDRVRLDPRPTQIGALIDEVRAIWTRAAEEKGIRFEASTWGDLSSPRIVDPGRLRQILDNLISNAIKFTEAGFVRAEIGVDEDAGPDRLILRVSDTGQGVALENVERIFQPFEQGDMFSRRRHGGMGLGLHVSRRLAQAMGGDIQLESEVGKGAVFTVTLEAPSLREDVGLEIGDAVVRADRPMRILCVDDNVRNLVVLSAILRAAGHQVDECASGTEALGMLESRRFDAVLLDMVMPTIDGLDVFRALRAQPGPNRDTPVIACTANVMPDQLKRYAEFGLDRVVRKPLQSSELLATLQSIMSDRAKPDSDPDPDA